MPSPPPLPQPPALLRQKHSKYWLRSLRTLLPHDYTSNDSQRMTLGFFILSSLDLLDCLHPSSALSSASTSGAPAITPSERASYISWIYHCQHPKGGFRGFPATDLGPEHTTPENEHWDPASLAATWFALASLVVLGDGLEGVQRGKIWRWCTKLQRRSDVGGDGSFGEMLGEGGSIEGGGDPRFAYFAAAVRWMLRGEQGRGVPAEEGDIDVDGLAEFIGSCEAYDGGFAESPSREAHAGLTYCAIGTLALLGRLPPSQPSSRAPSRASEAPHPRGLGHLDSTIHWLVSRQVAVMPAIDDRDEDASQPCSHTQAADPPLLHQPHHAPPAPNEPHSVHATAPLPPPPSVPQHYQQAAPTAAVPIHRRPPPPSSLPSDSAIHAAGFNGRPSKPPDTCYSFWVCGSLSILGLNHVISPSLNRRYLLEHTQHPIAGGFGKIEGDPPDVLHSYLGLASLALQEGREARDGLAALDPVLCVSRASRARLVGSGWWTGQSGREDKQ